MTLTSENVNNPDCPRCGRRDIFSNEYGVHQCLACGRIWEPGLGQREGSTKVRSEPTQTTWGRLQELADSLHLSPRRLYDQARKGKVLGVTYDNGWTFHHEAKEMKGPIADTPQQVLLPPGTRGISVEVCPESPISGRIYVTKLDTTRKHPIAILQAEDGHSGPIVQIVCQVLDP